MTRFVAIDVETANADMASICQIGGVVFEGGVEVDHFSTLIDPEDYFDGVNISIHGITEADVVGAPTFRAYHAELCARTHANVVVCHTHFDRVSLGQACARATLAAIECRWLDSAKMARRAWQDIAYRGYGLASVADKLGITFQQHDALHDARTAGLILLAAMKDAALDLEGCIERCWRPLSDIGRHTHEAGDGPLADQRIVFTGSLEITRGEAARIANAFGAAIDASVTKKTTMLVVGDQDVVRLRGAEKSSKHCKAEALIRQGQPIRIVRESDFSHLCDGKYEDAAGNAGVDTKRLTA